MTNCMVLRYLCTLVGDYTVPGSSSLLPTVHRIQLAPLAHSQSVSNDLQMGTAGYWSVQLNLLRMQQMNKSSRGYGHFCYLHSLILMGAAWKLIECPWYCRLLEMTFYKVHRGS